MQEQDVKVRQRKTVNAELLGIGELARTCKVTLRALRFYEERGLITPLRFGASRFYDQTARTRLRLILKGKQLGFTLAEIQEMIEARGDEAMPAFELSLEPDQVLAQIDMLERQQAGIERAISELRETHERLSAAAMAGAMAHTIAAE